MVIGGVDEKMLHFKGVGRHTGNKGKFVFYEGRLEGGKSGKKAISHGWGLGGRRSGVRN